MVVINDSSYTYRLYAETCRSSSSTTANIVSGHVHLRW